MASLLRRAGSVLVVGTATLLGAVGGGYLGQQSTLKSEDNGIPTFWKSFKSDDPLIKYVTDHSLRLDSIQKQLMEETMKHPWAAMMGAPEICQLLQNLIRSMNMKNVIEIGVFTGFSTLGFALALPEDGVVVACDINNEYAEIGRPFWKEAGVDQKIDLKIQLAIKTLDDLLAEGKAGTFDMAFIDADKEGYDTYYEKCLLLLRKGGIIAIDNVFWSNTVLEENPTKPGAKEIKKLNEKLKSDQRIDISMLVIGDGLTLAFKR